MALTTLAPASCSVTQVDALDVQVVVTFTPSAPIGLTEVTIPGEDIMSATHVLGLLDAALDRLMVYVEDFRQAAEADTP